MTFHTLKHQPKPPQAPLNLLASWRSFCMMVTLFACIAHRLVSSNKWTRKASLASCRAWIAWLCHLSSWPTWNGRIYCAISRTSREKGSFSISRSVDCWYRLISRSALVPGLKRCGLRRGMGSPAVIQLVKPIAGRVRNGRRRTLWEREAFPPDSRSWR